MEIELTSFAAGAAAASGTVVVIDVFRAFTAAAVALAQGARRIIMVASLDEALALRANGEGDRCMGERHGAEPEGFDFGNSPSELERASLTGLTLIQTTSNGTAGIAAARSATRLYAGAFVTAEATVRALLRESQEKVTLVAMGRNGRRRADEDELCAFYLRARLEGRAPDKAAISALLTTMPSLPDARLIASGEYDLRDRAIAAEIDRADFAIRVRSENGRWVAAAEH